MRSIILMAAATLLLSGCVTQAQRAQNQAEMNASVPKCMGKRQCDAAWEAATVWVSRHCGMKIQTTNDVLIQTYNSVGNNTATACTVNRMPVEGNVTAIVMNVSCGNIFGCFPDGKETVLEFGAAVRAASAKFEPLKIGVNFTQVDSTGKVTESFSESMGLRVDGTVAGGRAAMAGLRDQDVVMAVDDKRVRNFDDWLQALDARGPGDVLSVKVRRAGQDEILKMPL